MKRNVVRWLFFLGLGIGLILLPFFADTYILYLVGTVGIYTIVTLSLNVVLGTTGQLSIGHSAFFAIGAYTSTILMLRLGIPFLFAAIAAAALSGMTGLIVGLPATRLRGPYLAISTLAFGILIQHILREWESMTGGRAGLTVPEIGLGPPSLKGDTGKYYVILVAALVTGWITQNLLRSRIGFAWRALKDSETAALSVGVGVPWYKAQAFGVSAFFTGLAGAVYAPYIGYISYEAFGPMMAISFVSAVILGGLNSTVGAVLGAAYLALAPEIFRGLEQVQMIAYGLVMVLVILFLPRGLMEIPHALKGLIRTLSEVKTNS